MNGGSSRLISGVVANTHSGFNPLLMIEALSRFSNEVIASQYTNIKQAAYHSFLHQQILQYTDIRLTFLQEVIVTTEVLSSKILTVK